MPAVNFSQDDWLVQQIQQLQQQVQALQTQQQYVIVDAQLRQRVQLGLLNNGDYGLLVTDPVNSVQTEYLPVYQNVVAATEGTSSASYTDLTTAGPSVTVTIGASGMAQIFIGSYIGVTAVQNAQAGGFVGVATDGVDPVGGIGLDELLYFAMSTANVVPSCTGIASSQSGIYVVSGLSPGTHTFKMRYKAAGGGTSNFSSRFIQVRPL